MILKKSFIQRFLAQTWFMDCEYSNVRFSAYEPITRSMDKSRQGGPKSEFRIPRKDRFTKCCVAKSWVKIKNGMWDEQQYCFGD